MEMIKSNKKIYFYLKITLTLVIFWFLMHNSQLKLGLCSAIFECPVSTLIIVLLCYVMVIFHTWRWFRLNLVQGINLSFFRTLLPTYLGIAFNTVLPGSVGGDFVRLYYVLKNFPQQKSKAVLAIMVDRITGLMGIFVIACILAPFYLDAVRHDTALFYLLIVCATVCIVSAVLFISVLVLLSEKVGFATWLTVKFHHKQWSHLLVSILEAIHVYRKSKLVILESLVVSIMTQLLLLIVVVIISKMMGLPMLSLFDYMLALVIGQVANLVPLTPGGVGIGEAAFANIILILHPGMTAAYATVFFALRLISTAAYLPGVVVGIFGFHLLDKKQQADDVEVSVSPPYPVP